MPDPNTQTPQPPHTTQQPQNQAPQQPLSPAQMAQLRLLMDKEKSVREAEARLKAQEKDVQWAQELRAMKDKNPMGILEKLGLSREELTKSLSENEGTQTTSRLERQLGDLTQRLEEMQRRESEYRQQQTVEAAQKEIKGWLRNQKDGDKSKYAAIEAAGLDHLVFDRIQSLYNESGKLPSYDDAAQHVENELREFARKLAPIVQPESTSAKNAPNSIPGTLSNSIGTSTTMPPDPSGMSAHELNKAALALLKFDSVE